jgi:hypothetical protein
MDKKLPCALIEALRSGRTIISKEKKGGKQKSNRGKRENMPGTWLRWTGRSARVSDGSGQAGLFQTSLPSLAI